MSDLEKGRVSDERQTSRDERLEEPRMWLLVRRDLAMPLGKALVQAGHGFGTCLWLSTKRDPELVDRYMETSQAKVAVSVRSEVELRKVLAACDEAGLVTSLIEDAGHTVFDRPTVTLGAVGPCLRAQLPKVAARLQLVKDRPELAEGGEA